MQTRTGLQTGGISPLSARLHAYNEKRKWDRTIVKGLLTRAKCSGHDPYLTLLA